MPVMAMVGIGLFVERGAGIPLRLSMLTGVALIGR